MACVGTWSFSEQALCEVAKLVVAGSDCVSALEAGINVVEDDPSTGPYFVGRGCYPNKRGIVQLDAALMRGIDCAFGAVAGLERYPRPISVARKVLNNPSLSMLVGTGATDFAAENGFILESNMALISDKFNKDGVHDGSSSKGHDTLSSGDGDTIMRFCPSFQIVESMKHGKSPQDACEYAVKRIIDKCGERTEVALIALDIKGNVGAATTVKEWIDFQDQKKYDGFPYATWKVGEAVSIKIQPPVTL